MRSMIDSTDAFEAWAERDASRRRGDRDHCAIAEGGGYRLFEPVLAAIDLREVCVFQRAGRPIEHDLSF